ncbi:hypothetical protein EZS27_030580 [termite gut metagenome]|uniref:Uncharacterized protein n=1 Tax=termite gut metagenome TaxID=433724 RepID=A0A5J4QF63_9ZZZZ
MGHTAGHLHNIQSNKLIFTNQNICDRINIRLF